MNYPLEIVMDTFEQEVIVLAEGEMTGDNIGLIKRLPDVLKIFLFASIHL